MCAWEPPEAVAFPKLKLFWFRLTLLAGLNRHLLGCILSITSAIHFRSTWRSSSSSDMRSNHGRNLSIFDTFSRRALVQRSWSMLASSCQHIVSLSMWELVPGRAMFNV